MATVELDADFLALPLEGLRSAALDRAQALGCENAEVRIERIRSQVVRLRDGHLETSADDLELGMGIRVVHEGSFGFAATVELDSAAAAALAEEAVATARATAPAFASVSNWPRSRRTARRSGPPPTRSTPPRCPPPRRWRCSGTGATACCSLRVWTT